MNQGNYCLKVQYVKKFNLKRLHVNSVTCHLSASEFMAELFML